MGADIPQTRTAKQRIYNSVDEDVAIAVSGKPFFKRNFYAAQDQRTPFDQGMYVYTDTGAGYH
jgi:hypothetical protein